MCCVLERVIQTIVFINYSTLFWYNADIITASLNPIEPITDIHIGTTKISRVLTISMIGF